MRVSIAEINAWTFARNYNTVKSPKRDHSGDGALSLVFVERLVSSRRFTLYDNKLKVNNDVNTFKVIINTFE